MFKKIVAAALVLLALFSTSALAAVTNRDIQLQGGVLVSNATDSFFFCPMEPGMTRQWRLYALNGGDVRTLVEADGIPARLIHADEKCVYFLVYIDAERTLHTLYAVDITTLAVEELLTDIATAFVEDSNVFLYVTKSDPYMLCRYNLTTRKQTDIKSMKKSEKTIYDALVFKGTLYFTTKDSGGLEDGYKFNDGTGLANNLDKPTPSLVSSVLYEGYRLYYTDKAGSLLYSVKLGNKNGSQIGAKHDVSMTSPRFGDAVYAYNGDTHSLVRFPLDNSGDKSLRLEGDVLNRLILGGYKDELLLYNYGGIYAVTPSLSSQTRLFDFDTASGGLLWTHIVHAANNAIAVFGYNADTVSNISNMPPTGMYIFDRGTGNLLFGYPDYDPDNPPEVGFPEILGEPPVPEPEDGETYFDYHVF